jgi:magnesium transporter
LPWVKVRFNEEAKMLTIQTTHPKQLQNTYFLSNLIGLKILLNGKKIGKLDDVIAKENGTLPVVTQIFVSRPLGDPSLIIPWKYVRVVGKDEIVVDIPEIKSFEGEPEEGCIRLKDHLLDKKVLDTEERELDVVYDIRLVAVNNQLFVSDVDISRTSFLRRLGLGWMVKRIPINPDQNRMISWKYVQHLPGQLGSFKGNVKLTALKETLNDMPPVDIADILEEVDHEQRVEIFANLDPDQASDTLEEINPNVQRDLVSSLSKDKIALLIDDMTPGQAADVLSVLPTADAEDIITLLNPDNARKVKAIIDHQEENILDFTTSEFLMYSPDEIVEKVQDNYRTAARGKDVVMYLYIVDADKKLLGVVDIKELLMAEDHFRLKDIMTENIVAIENTDTLKEAYDCFERYNFRALPVVNADGRILGVVTYRDIIGLKHHFVD